MKIVAAQEGWKAYECEHNVQQKDYQELAEFGRVLTDEEAIDIIVDEFGFQREKIEIVHEVAQEMVDEKGYIRCVGTYERKPVFEAWDWNYIRFNVKANVTRAYEMWNDDLKLFWA